MYTFKAYFTNDSFEIYTSIRELRINLGLTHDEVKQVLNRKVTHLNGLAILKF